MSRDPRLRLDDILDAANAILGWIEGMDFEHFREDRKTTDAVLRNLEVIGEAMGKLPEEWRALYGEIPWRSVIAFRNVIAHEYFQIDLEIVWDAARNRLPEVRQTCRKLLAALERNLASIG